jgi:serine/threonine protein kinase
MIGKRLGPYEVLAKLGEGGMGEVYRARDAKLNRDVALKILSNAVVTDANRLARFRREAQVLASLNHPNIAAIYGFEDSGATHALVLELVEGPTLADVIRSRSERRSSTLEVLEWAIPIARQMSAALECAHESGIVHRDLKPANIKVRADGAVKVLDFGLAKGLDPAAGSSADVMNSPTLTSPAMTQAGMILGTAAYMAPEQARGRAVDKRADVWAFGAVLFEMLTGARAFPGEDLTDTLAAVVRAEPNWTLLPPGVPPALVVYLKRCLHKDPKQRIPDMAAMRLALDGAFDAAAPATATAVRQSPPTVVWASAAIAVVSLAVAAYALWSRPASIQQPSARLTISLPPGSEITSAPAITADGTTVAYVARQGTEDSQLYLRDLSSFETRTVPGSRGARQPFFSPDGKWVAFFAQGQLQKAEVAGGAPVRIVEAAYPFGGTWTQDNTIVYASSLGSGLLQIPATGGAPKSISKPDGAANGYAHVWPQALPGGRVLFTVWGQKRGNAVLWPDSGQWELVLPTTTFASALFDTSSLSSGSGRLLLVDDTAGLRAAPFDPTRPALTSADASVLDDVYSDISTESRGWLATSNNGTAVYAHGNPSRASLVWVDSDGKTEPLRKEQDVYQEVRISPDGAKAIVRSALNLWIHDLQRGTRSPLTSGNDSNILPVWSRDGRRILFASNRGGDWDIYSQAADGSGTAEILLKRPLDQFPYSVASDGTLLYTEIQARTGRDLWKLSPDGKVSPVRVTQFNELAPQFSPSREGPPRWIAYTSDESGRTEIYVQSYPADERRFPISTGGGTRPMWSPDGNELFYVSGDDMMVVVMQPNGTLGTPRKLFDRSNFLINDRFQSYSISPESKRFLMIQRDPGSVPNQLNVILNWFDATARPKSVR